MQHYLRRSFKNRMFQKMKIVDVNEKICFFDFINDIKNLATMIFRTFLVS